MRKNIFVSYDCGLNGDYMGEALRLAKALAADGHKDVAISDLGNGAEVTYDEQEFAASGSGYGLRRRVLLGQAETGTSPSDR